LSLAFYYIISHYGKKGIDTNLATSNEKYSILEWFQSGANSPHKEDFSSGTDKHLHNYFSQRSRHFHVLEKQFIGIIGFKILFIGILLFLGAYLVQTGELNIGQFIASEIIIFLVINAVEKLVSSLNICYDIITALYKIESVFSEHHDFSFIEGHPAPLASLKGMYTKPYSQKIKMGLLALLLSAVILLFMPWTQNIRSSGKVSTLNPEFKPQEINSRIAGRVEKWFIKEGDYVKKNDTIAFISEVKDEYVDPQLISRSEKIIKSKETSLGSYEEKIKAVNAQIDALNKSLQLKMAQARNKITQCRVKILTDSIECQVAANNYKVAEEQLLRYEDLMAKGVISKTDLENRRVKLQEALSKKTGADNKLLSAKNDLLNAEIDLNSLQQDFQEKLMKAESDKFSALSLLYEGEGSLTKLQNQLANYSMRKGFYYVLAPQDGYIAKTHIRGIGEVIKDGAALCEIVPMISEKAVELYVMPVDLPLIEKGQRVQIQFDGWPAFVFSGWPGISYGTYAAEIVAFDRTLSDNGKFRVLAKSVGKPWPSAIQLGGGVKGFALLSNVPLIYELWRQVNGFPPEFYATKKVETKK
jgi:multidrug resistance efflux pump